MSCRKSKLKQVENDEALKAKLRLTPHHRGRQAITINSIYCPKILNIEGLII